MEHGTPPSGGRPPRVVILLHETDPYPEGYSYFLFGLCDVWRAMGIDVQIVKGLRRLPSADLVVPHLDLTTTPRRYRRALDRLPRVANPGVYDISKRRVSANLLDRTSTYAGPVIVKTDRNYGGLPERVVAFARRRSRVLRKARDLARRVRRRDTVVGCDYLLFDTLADVPPRAFADRRVVVEKFQPETDGETYYVRWYIFCGDRFRSMRVGTHNPLVKMSNLTSKEFGLPIPPAVLAMRARWRLDFGKIDFVMHNGEPVILDVNRTPSDVAPPERFAQCQPYGPGIWPLLRSEKATDMAHVDIDSQLPTSS